MLPGLRHHVRVYNRQSARIFLRHCTATLTLAMLERVVLSLVQNSCCRCYWLKYRRHHGHSHIANEKKRSRETQTLRTGCSKAEPTIFAPPQTPFSGAQDGQNLITWRWSLPLATNPFLVSMHAI